MLATLHACGPMETSNLDQGDAGPPPVRVLQVLSLGKLILIATLEEGRPAVQHSSTSDEPGPGVFPLRNQGVLYTFQEGGRLET